MALSFRVGTVSKFSPNSLCPGCAATRNNHPYSKYIAFVYASLIIAFPNHYYCVHACVNKPLPLSEPNVSQFLLSLDIHLCKRQCIYNYGCFEYMYASYNNNIACSPHWRSMSRIEQTSNGSYLKLFICYISKQGFLLWDSALQEGRHQDLDIS